MFRTSCSFFKKVSKNAEKSYYFEENVSIYTQIDQVASKGAKWLKSGFKVFDDFFETVVQNGGVASNGSKLKNL